MTGNRRLAKAWASWSRTLLSWIYPTKCCLCDLLGDEDLCSVCRDSFESREPLISRAYGDTDLGYWAALFEYTDRAAQAVQRLKYARATALAEPMSRILAETAQKEGLLEVDMIVPVPIHWSRRCTRGFNQSEMLAEALALARNGKGQGGGQSARLHTSALKRIRATRPQVGLTQDERMENLRGAFAASPEVAGNRVLLVDDVLTSGQTARECARSLKQSGAAEVGILCFAGAII